MFKDAFFARLRRLYKNPEKQKNIYYLYKGLKKNKCLETCVFSVAEPIALDGLNFFGRQAEFVLGNICEMKISLIFFIY